MTECFNRNVIPCRSVCAQYSEWDFLSTEASCSATREQDQCLLVTL